MTFYQPEQLAAAYRLYAETTSAGEEVIDCLSFPVSPPPQKNLPSPPSAVLSHCPAPCGRPVTVGLPG
jgi:hypothetical protein